uniref:Uncharacterized protein n=1 Tax=Ditylum brightwellii TaxID=49249 RepID=A0A6U3QCS3_9STRA|mmetsp:Transcript_19738/g.29431  ORF Transcript_19738/g.29431 Transcript_19738/m.29431 type:complete len:618 (+) Transcript_19738:34-1887(+)
MVLLPALLVTWMSTCLLSESFEVVAAFTPSTKRTYLHAISAASPSSRVNFLNMGVPTSSSSSPSSPSSTCLYAVKDEDKSAVYGRVMRRNLVDEATLIQKLEAKYTTEITRLKFSLADARQDLEQMEGMADTFESLSKSLEERLDAEVEEKTVELQKLEQELTEKFGEQLEKVKYDAENKEREKVFELVSLQGMISDLEDTIQKMESKAKEMESKISGLRVQVQDEIEKKRAELQALEAQLTEKFNAEKDLMKIELRDNDELIEKLKQEAVIQEQEFQVKSKMEKERLDKIIKSLQKDVKNITNELKKKRAQEGSWRRKINETRSNFMRQLRKTQMDAAKELNNMKVKMSQEMQYLEQKAKEDIGRLTQERDEVKKDLSDMTVAKNELSTELISFREEMTELLAETKQNVTNEFEAFRDKTNAETTKQLSELRDDLTEKLRIATEKAEAEENRLTEELEKMTEEASFQKSRSHQLIADLETTRKNMRAEIIATKNKANRDFMILRAELTKQMVDAKVKAEFEYSELLKERNKSVSERDSKIEEQAAKISSYETERSSIRTMTRISVQLMRSRMKKRLKSTRKGVANVSRRAIKRKDGTSRLAFMKRRREKKGGDGSS